MVAYVMSCMYVSLWPQVQTQLYSDMLQARMVVPGVVLNYFDWGGSKRCWLDNYCCVECPRMIFLCRSNLILPLDQCRNKVWGQQTFDDRLCSTRSFFQFITNLSKNKNKKALMSLRWYLVTEFRIWFWYPNFKPTSTIFLQEKKSVEKKM